MKKKREEVEFYCQTHWGTRIYALTLFDWHWHQDFPAWTFPDSSCNNISICEEVRWPSPKFTLLLLSWCYTHKRTPGLWNHARAAKRAIFSTSLFYRCFLKCRLREEKKIVWGLLVVKFWKLDSSLFWRLASQVRWSPDPYTWRMWEVTQSIQERICFLFSLSKLGPSTYFLKWSSYLSFDLPQIRTWSKIIGERPGFLFLRTIFHFMVARELIKIFMCVNFGEP